MREKRLYSYLRAINADDLDIYNFKDRLKLQKYIYLLQEFGIDLGFRFRYYIRGPYSPDLADAGYRLKYMKDAGLLTSMPQIDRLERDPRIIKFNKFIEKYRDNIRMLELFATIHFLYKYSYYPKPKTEIKIKEYIRESETKPHFTDEEFEEAFVQLKKLGLI